MKKRMWKKGLAAMLGLVLSIQTPVGGMVPLVTAQAEERAATINATSLNVRSGAGTGYSSVAKLGKGTEVKVIGETNGADGKLWYQIRFTGNGGITQSGYVLGTYVKFPVTYSHDGDFEAQLNAQGFPESYKDSLRQIHARYPNWTFTAQHTGLDWNSVIQNEAVLGRNLVHKNSISSYKSLSDGAYNWDNSTWTGFDGNAWVAASEDVLRYYMDPRNFLDEVSIFQFMDQTYNPSVHTREGLESMLKGTFMESGVIAGGGSPVSSGGSTAGSSGGSGGPGVGGSPVINGGSSEVSKSPVIDGSSPGMTSQAPGSNSDSQVGFQGPSASISRHEAAFVSTSAVVIAGPGVSSENQGDSSVNVPADGSNISYVDAIMNAAQASGTSPYVIAAMIIQEQGSNGRGNSISGNYAGYVGYYNYFNVGAYASDGMGPVERGLWYASQSGTYGRPWTTPAASILGGAEFYGTNYVKAGQDTLYLKKYNVQGDNLYKHQYMTNVDGAASEGSIFAEGFTAHQKSTALNFKIPVYTNMPELPCSKPTADGSPNNKLSGLDVEGLSLTPTFHRDTEVYDLIVDHSASAVRVNASAIDSKATVTGTGSIQLQSGNNDISVVVRAENGMERTYTIRVVRQAGAPTYHAEPDTGGTEISVVSPSPVVGQNHGISAGADTVTLQGPGVN